MKFRLFVAFATCLLPLMAHAAPYSETVSGDLSNNRLAPTLVPLTLGGNPIDGAIINTDLDYLTIQVPAAAELSAIIFETYESSNARAFLGMQAGSTFTVDPPSTTPGVLLGYTHFGIDQLIGSDLLDDLAAGVGAIGFTSPLPAGDYTFWINQTEPSLTGYRFNFTVVPEPGSMSILTATSAMITTIRRLKPDKNVHQANRAILDPIMSRETTKLRYSAQTCELCIKRYHFPEPNHVAQHTAEQVQIFASSTHAECIYAGGAARGDRNHRGIDLDVDTDARQGTETRGTDSMPEQSSPGERQFSALRQ
jgi:hypothetical protein